jgi:ribonuclease BN (tRNA processing enzyme)
MRLVVLGAGTLVPQAHRASAGLAVLSWPHAVAVDLGRNVLSRMVENGVDPLRLSQVLLSHLHPDHSCELVSLLFARNYGVERPSEHPMRLVGPVGTRALVEALQRAWRWLEPRFDLRIDELEGRMGVELDGFAVQAIPVEHGSVPAYGYRIEAVEEDPSPVVAFTGDTGYCPGLVDLARDVDALVAECSTSDARAVDGHLSPSSLGRALREARARRVIVTHLAPETDPGELQRALEAHSGVVPVLAHDGWSLEI